MKIFIPSTPWYVQMYTRSTNTTFEAGEGILIFPVSGPKTKYQNRNSVQIDNQPNTLFKIRSFTPLHYHLKTSQNTYTHPLSAFI